MRIVDHRYGRVAATYGQPSRDNGYFVPVLPKTDFVFDGRVNSPVAAQEFPVAVGIDSSSWVSAVLLVRVHAKLPTWLGVSSLTVNVDNIMLVPEEPDVIFAPNPLAPIATSPNLGLTTVLPGSLYVVNFTAPIGPQLRVRLSYLTTTAGASANTISLGIDLVGRPA